MFQNNPLLAQLKQQLHDKTLRVEGVVKGTDKSFGFLETDNQKSYFIPPAQMKKVMHGDRVTAAIVLDKEREIVEPETLVEQAISRFIGQIKIRKGRYYVVNDQPFVNQQIVCTPSATLGHELNEDDWVVAYLTQHPLADGERGFFKAEIREFICTKDAPFLPWWITLARYGLEKTAPVLQESLAIVDESIERIDLTHLPFFTIDNETTEDIDDAIYITPKDDGCTELFVAIADPSAYFVKDGQIDKDASERALTHYMPGFNVPMLPDELTAEYCSLKPNSKKLALVCRTTILPDGRVADDVSFECGWIVSHHKLSYNQVSDWLEGEPLWQPDEPLAEQLHLLHLFAQKRHSWRVENALTFQDRPDYRFSVNDHGDVLGIRVEHRRVANKMIEEAMVVANIAAAQYLSEKLGFAIFSTHVGFAPNKVEQVKTLFRELEIAVPDVASFEGYIALRRQLDALGDAYLDMRCRKYLNYADISATPAPHFGLGLSAYATWTSPLRKYTDLVNHRLLKSVIASQAAETPSEALLQHLNDRRRLNKLAERELNEWLYCLLLADAVENQQQFAAEVIDITRNGMRARLLDNGAVVFIPASLIHNVRNELTCNQERGMLLKNGEELYRLADNITVKLTDINPTLHSIVASVV